MGTGIIYKTYEQTPGETFKTLDGIEVTIIESVSIESYSRYIFDDLRYIFNTLREYTDKDIIIATTDSFSVSNIIPHSYLFVWVDTTGYPDLTKLSHKTSLKDDMVGAYPRLVHYINYIN